MYYGKILLDESDETVSMYLIQNLGWYVLIVIATEPRIKGTLSHIDSATAKLKNISAVIVVQVLYIILKKFVM